MPPARPARGGPPAVAGSADRTCAREFGARSRGRAAGQSSRRRGVEGGIRPARRSGGTVASRPSSIEPGRRRPVGPGRRLGGRSPSGSCTGRTSVEPAPAPLRRSAEAASGARTPARSRPGRSVVRVGPGRILGGRGAPVPGTPVRACAGLRTRAGSASSTCPMSCRTSCCRPSRGRTAGRRPRRSWSSRAVALRGPRRLSASGRPGSPDDGGRPPDRPVEPPSSGGVPFVGGASWYARRVASARAASACHGVRGPAEPGLSSWSARSATDELLVGGLDLEEARERSLAAGVGVVLLREPAIRPLTSSSEALRGNPRTRYGSCTCHRRPAASATQLADRGEARTRGSLRPEPAVRVT